MVEDHRAAADPDSDVELPPPPQEVEDILFDLLHLMVRGETEGHYEVTRQEKDGAVEYNVKPVGPKAAGVVLGRRGATAKALRLILDSVGRAQGLRMLLHVDVEPRVAKPAPRS